MSAHHETVALELLVVEHDGQGWALCPEMAVRLPPEQLLDLLSVFGALPPPPQAFLERLANAPSPKSARVELRPGATHRQRWIGSVSVDADFVAVVLAMHPAAVGRASAWWEPVYAFADEAVCAIFMGFAPPGQGMHS